MAIARRRTYTPEEYLAREEKSDSALYEGLTEE